MRQRGIFIKVVVLIAAVLLIGAGAAFLYRYQILQYSADAVVRKLLPPYIEVDKVVFEPQLGRMVLGGFRIINPPEFSYKYLLEIDEIVMRYRMKGKNVLDGIEVLEPELRRPVLTIERLGNGALNIQRMPQFIKELTDGRSGAPAAGKKEGGRRESPEEKGIDTRVQALVGNRTVADVVTIPENFRVRDGRLLFVDRFGFSKPQITSLDKIAAQLALALDTTYTRVLRVGSEGTGIVDDEKSQTVAWKIRYDPTTPRLTMSNRFDVAGVDILTFKPYYDRYSPFDFRRGYFSGTLVFDFDNGNIGSSNEIQLAKLAFLVKEPGANTSMWDAPSADLAKYFTTANGDVVFDFKIKGDMNKPKFYLGPISRQAVTAMAVDKVSQVLQQVAEQAAGTAQGAASAVTPGAKTNAEKTAEYISLISDLIGKKQ